MVGIVARSTPPAHERVVTGFEFDLHRDDPTRFGFGNPKSSAASIGIEVETKALQFFLTRGEFRDLPPGPQRTHDGFGLSHPVDETNCSPTGTSVRHC